MNTKSFPGPSAAPKPWQARVAVLGLAVSMFGCDHATKLYALNTLSGNQGGQTTSLLRGVLELRYAENHDTAFGTLGRLGIPHSPYLLVTVAFLATMAVAFAWLQALRNANFAQHVGFALLAAGALGNLVDRALRGYVIDFIHVRHWPIFNVADIAVVIGVGLLALPRMRRSEASLRTVLATDPPSKPPRS
jgi:signal peptidase II